MVAGFSPVRVTTFEYVLDDGYVTEVVEQVWEDRLLLEVPYCTQGWLSFSYVFQPMDTATLLPKCQLQNKAAPYAVDR